MQAICPTGAKAAQESHIRAPHVMFCPLGSFGMEQERTNWNDDRLDHLAVEVRELRNHIDDRFDRLQVAMIVSLASILAAFGAAFGGALVAF